MSTIKKAGITVLALSLTMGLATTPSQASPPDHAKAKQNQNKNAQKNKKDKKNQFYDLKEAEWAINHIIKMSSRGVFIGDGKGNFMPNKPITRSEAVVAAVRLMGLEDKALAYGKVNLKFKDAEQIKKHYSWAEGYIAVALENGLFDASLDKFQPEKPATREWVATLLVRALNLSKEANAKMNASLPFKDAKSISAGAFGYVAVAAELGLITGYTDKTFQPNKPITRAEMAALLDRMEWFDDQYITGLRGTVHIISPYYDELYIRTAKGDLRAIELDDDIYVYLDGKPAALKDIRVGYTITVVFDEDGDVVLIDLRTGKETPVVEWLSGQVDRITLPTSRNNGTIEVKIGREYKAFTLTNKTKVYTDSLDLDLTDVLANSEIKFKVDRDIVEEISVKGTVRNQEGTITRIDTRNNRLFINSGRTDVAYTLAPVVLYTKDRKEIKLDDLRVGDTIKLTTFNDYVKLVDVKYVADTGKYEGFVEGLRLPTSTRDGSLTFYSNRQVNTYTLTNKTKVKSGNFNLHLSDLAVDQDAVITVDRGTVIEIDIVGNIDLFKGEVKKIVLPSRSSNGSITLDRNGNEVTFLFAQELSATYNKRDLPLKDLQVGDHVELTTFNAKVKHILVMEQYKEPVYEEVKGEITYINLPTRNRDGSIRVQIDRRTWASYTIDQNVKVVKDKDKLTLSDLKLGQEVNVKLKDEKVVEIEILD